MSLMISSGNKTSHPIKKFCKNGHDTFIGGRDKYHNCRTCINLREMHRRNTNITYRIIKKEAQWKRYGIKNKDGSYFTQVNYDRQYQLQSGQCAGCHTHQSDLKTALQADHDHITGIFRYLLCMNCNRALGHAQDNPIVLRNLASLMDKKVD